MAVEDAYGIVCLRLEEKVLESASRVEEAAVMVPEAPRAILVPFTVRDELARSVLATVAHVAEPAALRERTNWLVHDVPPYAPARPVASSRMSAEVMESSRSRPFISTFP